MTHTPGPWHLNKDRVSVAIPYRGEHCVTSTYGGTEANARLIAAAPDLLAALHAMRQRWDLYTGGMGGGGHTDDRLMQMADAAIARATTASKEGE